MQGGPSDALSILHYTEEYLEFLENVPNVLQPHLSRIRKLDADFLEVLSRLKELQEELEGGEWTNGRKSELLREIKDLLVEGQRVGDEKLEEIALVSELRDQSLAKLDARRKHLGTDPQKKPENSRVIRSNVSITGARSQNAASRAENGRAATSSSEEKRHYHDSRSTPSETNGNGAKRPRRQKQFPDFIRDLEYTGPPPPKPRQPSPTPPPSVPPRMKRKRSTGKRREVGGGRGNRKPPVLFDTPIDPEEPLYCICQQVSYGEMIGCDFNNCEIEWFHFSCVSLTSKPKGKWFCPNCRGDRPNSLKHGL